MSPERQPEDSEDEKEIDAGAGDDVVASTTEKQPTRRRTKTGCLTCRRRRIKCGEERPICKNCIKSKRECAGYVQPLIYKQHHQANAPFLQDAGRSAGLAGPNLYGFNGQMTSGWHSTFQLNQFGQQPQTVPQILQFNNGGYNLNAGNEIFQSREQLTNSTLGMGQSASIDPSIHSWPQYNNTTRSPEVIGQESSPTSAVGGHPSMWLPESVGNSSPWTGLTDQQGLPLGNLTTQHTSQAPWTTNMLGTPQTNFHGFVSSIPANPSHGVGDVNTRRYSEHGFVQQPTFNTSIPPSTLSFQHSFSSTPPSDEVLDDPEDPYDVEMEDIHGIEMTSEEAENDLKAMIERRQTRFGKDRKGSRHTKSSTQALASHRPSIFTSPLYDERNEWIFRHFIETTGQWMSIFERQPMGRSKKHQQTLWTFKIPAAALNHTALAHAILALGALHYSKLQRTSEDVALKHFTYAVRRVGKLLGLPQRRHELAILAAVLLLGFYEVMAADHSRWNLHLAGAMKLVTEHDFAGLTRVVYRMRSSAKAKVKSHAETKQVQEEDYLRIAAIPESLLNDIEWEVDQDLVSQLVGTEINYAAQSQPTFDSKKDLKDLTEKDVEDYKAKMDLRWWYCKQDVFQSMVSGDPLLMPSEHWIYCPPRAQIGRLEYPYGTLDHLLLIMARLADFGGKDRFRKQRAVAAQGGQWKPPPGFFPGGQMGPKTNSPTATKDKSPTVATDSSVSSSKSKVSDSDQTRKPSPPPSANEGRVRQSKPPVKSPQDTGGPPMYGMIPLPAQVQMHSSFHAMNETLQDKAFALPTEVRSASPEPDLDSETSNAIKEHIAITESFDLFSRSLGPGYEPLSSTSLPPIPTPFGPATRYQSPEIACIMIFYNVGRILLHRLHPHMPPAAMIASGVTAHLTRSYAQTVGKICAGLYASNVYSQTGILDSIYAGALLESSFSLFFAAIQYQDAAQRGWTISKLQDIDRKTGWQTSASMAAACESAWERIGLAGKGPPYVRTLDANNQDSRVNGSARRLAAQNATTGSDQDIVSEHESQFVSHDRNMIGRHGPTRVHWALGLLSVEEDIKKIDLNRK